MLNFLSICLPSLGGVLWGVGCLNAPRGALATKMAIFLFGFIAALMALELRYENSFQNTTFIIFGVIIVSTGGVFFISRLRGFNIYASVAIVVGVAIALYFLWVICFIATANDRMPNGTILYDHQGHKLGAGP